MSSSTVTYTSVYSDSEPWRFQWAPSSLDYVLGPEHPPSPDYVPGPEYPDYLVTSDDEVPIEDQPLPVDASPTTLSPSYVADSDLLEEDPEKDPVEYPADKGDDDDEEEDKASEEEEEYLALVDSTTLPAIDLTRLRRVRKTVRPQPPMTASAEALIAEYTFAPTPPLLPPSPLSPWSSLLLHISSPPLPVLSPPLPLPSLPTQTSPTYDQALLGYRVAMIRSRAALPPPVPSLHLLLPFTAHRDDIPETVMPIRKRARCTTLDSRFKVGESSAAAATRQARRALNSNVDYRFIDTVDASIHASESRMMTAVGEVNDRVTDLAATQTGDNLACWLLLMSLRLLRPIGHGLNLRVGANPWRPNFEHCRGMSAYFRDRGTMMKMPPKKTIAPMTDATIKQLIAQGVADVLAEYEANKYSRNGDDNHDSGSGGRRHVSTTHECTYSDFLKCQPFNFKGTKGVFSLTQWFKKMESVFHISNCTVACQIKFSTCTLLGSALTWWNSHVKTVGHDAAYGMPWKTLKKMMTAKMFPEESDEVEKYVDGLLDMIQGSVMASKPKIMQDAIEFATKLVD
ncbi:hypothetical protein Tco_0873652 [Tanacetum coccineum]|uniref:Retrotransposon gag domain-containing protein n=1 Tax=Tanacetum coccineum TaxID=301880 RepID=A0ABQ5BJE3_9ASTR